jgi:predicted ATPase
MRLKSIKIQNFKAIRDSKSIKITPLTTFIGNNGSGKSSIIEALQMLKELTLGGIDSAIAPWHGFEYIWNQANKHEVDTKSDRMLLKNPMSFELIFNGSSKLKIKLDVSYSNSANKVVFDKFTVNNETFSSIMTARLPETELNQIVESWQLLSLNPYSMLEPLQQKRSYGTIQLQPSGANIAEYLQSIRDMDIDAFNSIIDTLKYVLPYADDLKPKITSELERKVYLSLREKNIVEELPGWLLSTGTLRILAILAVLRHPQPPSIIMIEEIENGLDPRTIHLVIEEMRSFVQSGKGQIVVTTHSPFLLDLLTISQIVVVDRNSSGSPVFIRPEKNNELQDWLEEFTPGKLYTMGTLTGGE